jgi:indolepyruvate ferredoxin oxidoreductase, beta subunit
MSYDIVLCGVGGQGVLSLAAAIARAAMAEGLDVRQSEVHGMSQRGGAVVAHLRMSETSVKSDLVPKAMADMVLSMEPLESLRYVDYLKPEGVLIAASDPFVNISDYPDPETLYAAIRKLPRSVLVEAGRIAKEAGNAKAVNMVLVGAASKYLPLKPETIENAIRDSFASKGEKVIAVNLVAFRAGRG